MWRPHDQPVLTAMSSTAATGEDEDLMSYRENDDSKTFRVESVQTTPNSAILIKAGGVLHKVSPLSYGR